MKNLSLFLLVALISFASCSSTTQSDKKTTTKKPTQNLEVQKGMVNIDVAEFKKKMNGEDVVILDVRTPAETAQGIILGAIEIDVTQSTFKEKIQDLDKSKTYLVYCRSGRRSVTACKIMENEGFKNLYNLLDGYNAWK